MLSSIRSWFRNAKFAGFDVDRSGCLDDPYYFDAGHPVRVGGEGRQVSKFCRCTGISFLQIWSEFPLKCSVIFFRLQLTPFLNVAQKDNTRQLGQMTQTQIASNNHEPQTFVVACDYRTLFHA